MAAILKVWRQIENPTPQSMHIYVKNMPAKFHPEPICNWGSLGFFEENKNKKNKMSSDRREDLKFQSNKILWWLNVFIQ